MRCDFRHYGGASGECLGEATYEIADHERVRHACLSAAAEYKKAMQVGARCMDCRRPMWTHWSINPLALENTA